MMPVKDRLSFNAKTIINLQSIVLPGKPTLLKPGYAAHYAAAYQLWHDVVCEGLRSENLSEVADNLQSDGFVSQDEIHVLFNNDKPVGVFAFSWMDLSFKATRQQKYFVSNYPHSVIEKLQQCANPIIMTMGQLAVHPDWRRSKIGPCVSELLVGFAVKRLQESPADILLSFSRNNRKTHDLSYRYGAQPIVQNHQSHGIASDILTIHRNDALPSPIEGMQAAVDKLWGLRVFGLVA